MNTKLEQYILNLEDRAVAQYGLDNRRTRLIYRYTAFLRFFVFHRYYVGDVNVRDLPETMNGHTVLEYRKGWVITD